MSLYRSLIRPCLFRLDAETAHHGTVEACRWLGAVPGLPMVTRRLFEVRDPRLATEVAGLRFENPIGLAAGWDKSGRALRMLDAMGFGFAEIGSISARPSRGNPSPRLFRLTADRAILVNYGLPNDGAEVVAARIAAHRPRHPLGVNLVKTNDGPAAPPCDLDEVLADYEGSARLLHRDASYLALNLSCPNARDGIDLFAQPGNITRLLERLAPLDLRGPVFLKLAPRDDPAEHERILAECNPFPFVRGFLFNLSSGKPPSLHMTSPRERWADRPGAIAGAPVASLLERCLAGMFKRMDRRRHVLIGGGGIFTAEEAYRKIRLGASLVQLYTALVYEGPTLVPRICRDLARLLERDGFRSVADAVGTADH
jgi:dihydroorotate dehydrogenase (fumarate)/dihydroorotate dehydrogenase